MAGSQLVQIFASSDVSELQPIKLFKPSSRTPYLADSETSDIRLYMPNDSYPYLSLPLYHDDGIKIAGYESIDILIRTERLMYGLKESPSGLDRPKHIYILCLRLLSKYHDIQMKKIDEFVHRQQ